MKDLFSSCLQSVTTQNRLHNRVESCDDQNLILVKSEPEHENLQITGTSGGHQTSKCSKAVALLNTSEDCESDGGEEFRFSPADDSDTEFNIELTTDEDTSGTANEENCSPSRKKRLQTQDDVTSAPSVKALDGTVWETVTIKHLNGSDSAPNITFNGTAGPTEHAKVSSIAFCEFLLTYYL